MIGIFKLRRGMASIRGGPGSPLSDRDRVAAPVGDSDGRSEPWLIAAPGPGRPAIDDRACASGVAADASAGGTGCLSALSVAIASRHPATITTRHETSRAVSHRRPPARLTLVITEP
jgi:hypothetical protein